MKELKQSLAIWVRVLKIHHNTQIMSIFQAHQLEDAKWGENPLFILDFTKFLENNTSQADLKVKRIKSYQKIKIILIFMPSGISHPRWRLGPTREILLGVRN